MTDFKNQSGLKSGFSRRDFLRGSGAAAAVTALHGQGEAADEQAGPAVARGEQSITLHVNGQDCAVQVEPRTTLLDVLRNQLNLTGAKPVSRDGSSGASTVLIDGKPKTASTTLAMTTVGKKIETIECAGGDGADKVVKAFIDHDATQCGFCTPGFVIAVRSFVAAHPNASEEEIRSGLNGNICRCGTYANIIKAAIAVAKGG